MPLARVLVPTVVLVFASLGVAPAAAATPDPEANVPYTWRVVVQTRPHPLLTPAFRDALRRDLVAALPPALGPLGTVEVVDLAATPRDRWEPLWVQFDDAGFPALDAPRDLTGVKTHFLRVEVRDGVYHLAARQHDGFSGLASPVVRRQSTRAPELVGRTAGLMLDRDFGLAGTVEPAAGNPGEARVVFRGGGLGPLDRFVKVGDVFAVSRVSRTTRPAPPPVRTATGKVVAPPPGSVPPAALVAEAREFTYLRVAEAPAGGAARCVVLTNRAVGLPAAPGSLGYRCLKITTVAAPVAVRLANEDGAAAATPVASVRATEAGFDAAADPRDFLDFRDGLYRTPRPLSGVACVTVSLGATREARFPVPVFGPDPVTLRFAVDAKAEARAVFERAVLAVSARAADARVGQATCFVAVSRLIEARKNADALARARAGFDAADTADKTLLDEVKDLKARAVESPGAAELLTAVEQQLAALRTSNAQLAARVKDLDAVVAKESDPAALARDVQAQAVNARISLLLANGEIDEALTAYDQLATLLPESTDVKPRRDKLAAEWKPKDADHAKAREYLLATWPTLATAADIKDSLPHLRTAVDTCKKAGDKYSFRRFLGVLGGFPAKLKGLIKDLDPNAAADLKALQDAKAALDVVGKLDPEIAEFLRANP